ncbi:MAG: hypothetical protein FJ030_06170 [Chloroflexi bacterium]|nr:hypothetical protein [Chloroflexota bacterium]
MIEQATLLRLARDYANRKVKERPTMKAAVLIGSVARNEPPLGDAVDIDILLIDDAIPDPPLEIARLSDTVFVDAAFVRTADYADRKSLRAHHFTAPALNDALILHDPRHYFDILQASIRASYNKPESIHARARSALAEAQNLTNRLILWREDPTPDLPSLDLVDDLRRSIGLAAHAIILLSGQPGDAIGARKLMVRFEAAARQHQPELYPLFLAALGATDLQPSSIETMLADWLALYKSASQRSAPDPLTHPAKRGYYERGFRALIAEGHALNTLWLFEHTASACARASAALPDEWRNFLTATCKDSGAQFTERIRDAERLASLAESTLNEWAKRESVEL